jgi:hypothetical protein
MTINQREITTPRTDVRLLVGLVIAGAIISVVALPSAFGCFMAVTAAVNSHTAWWLNRKLNAAG